MQWCQNWMDLRLSTERWTRALLHLILQMGFLSLSWQWHRHRTSPASFYERENVKMSVNQFIHLASAQQWDQYPSPYHCNAHAHSHSHTHAEMAALILLQEIPDKIPAYTLVIWKKEIPLIEKYWLKRFFSLERLSLRPKGDMTILRNAWVNKCFRKWGGYSTKNILFFKGSRGKSS